MFPYSKRQLVMPIKVQFRNCIRLNLWNIVFCLAYFIIFTIFIKRRKWWVVRVGNCPPSFFFYIRRRRVAARRNRCATVILAHPVLSSHLRPCLSFCLFFRRSYGSTILFPDLLTFKRVQTKANNKTSEPFLYCKHWLKTFVVLKFYCCVPAVC